MSRVGRGRPPVGGGLLIAESRVPRALQGRHRPSRRRVGSWSVHWVRVIAQQKPASSRAAATAMIVRRLARASRRVQALLGAPGDGDRLGGLAGLAIGQRAPDTRPRLAVPGGLDEEPTGVTGPVLVIAPSRRCWPVVASEGRVRCSSAVAGRGRSARSRRSVSTGRPRRVCRSRAGSAAGRPALPTARPAAAPRSRARAHHGGARARRRRPGRRARWPARPASPAGSWRAGRGDAASTRVRRRSGSRGAATALRAGAGSASDRPGPPHARGRSHAAPPPRAREPGPHASCPSATSAPAVRRRGDRS
jgi:hypothetical protein